jgi:hypothetical protein
MSGQFHVAATLYQVKNAQYALNTKLCGPQSRFGSFPEENKLFPLLGIEPRLLGLSLWSNHSKIFYCGLNMAGLRALYTVAAGLHFQYLGPKFVACITKQGVH